MAAKILITAGFVAALILAALPFASSDAMNAAARSGVWEPDAKVIEKKVPTARVAVTNCATCRQS